jgi:hypothetical protein
VNSVVITEVPFELFTFNTCSEPGKDFRRSNVWKYDLSLPEVMSPPGFKPYKRNILAI